MSFLNSIGRFFVKLFPFLRSGLEKFIQDNKDIAVEEVKKLFTIKNGEDFHAWKDEAWQILKDIFSKDGKEIAGNWISLLLALAYEEIKGEIENKKPS